MKEKIFDNTISSFSGTLEVVNLHGGEKKFTIYTISGHPIKCIVKDDKRNVIAKLADKFIRVTGNAKYDNIGSFIPIELIVDEFEEIVEPTTDPFQKLKNSVDLGEDLPHDYINKLREDWL